VLESRLTADEDRISELEQNIVEAKEAATTSEQLLLEVRHALTRDNSHTLAIATNVLSCSVVR